jgi:hypothetical protein
MSRKTLTEAGKVTTNNTGKLSIQAISPGWGSSGFYSAEVLEAAGTNKVFPAGTHMYIDHPDAIEGEVRPERSVKDIAGILTEDATWNGTALVAEVQTVGPYKDALVEMKDAIGVSIRAAATVDFGEAEGRKGLVVQEIFGDTFNSIDFVTHAGRGGKILEVLESARRTLTETSASDAERAVRDAVNQAYSDSKAQTYAWVRDYDPDQKLVYFELDIAGVCTTYQQSYAPADSGDVELTGDKAEVNQRTVYVPVQAAASESATPIVPVHPTRQSTTIRENTMPENEGATTSIEESKRRELEEAAGRVPVLEAKLASETERANTAEQALAVEKARDYARDFGTKRVREANSELDPAAVDKIVAEAMRDLPLTEADKAADRRLDTEVFGKAVDTAQLAEETYLAKVIKGRGGSVQGLGQTDGRPEATEAQTNNVVAGAFGYTVKGA